MKATPAPPPPLYSHVGNTDAIVVQTFDCVLMASLARGAIVFSSLLTTKASWSVERKQMNTNTHARSRHSNSVRLKAAAVLILMAHSYGCNE